MGSIQEFGLGLIRSGHPSASLIQTSLSQLEEAKAGLDRAWQKRRATLEQARTLQVIQVCRDRGSRRFKWVTAAPTSSVFPSMKLEFVNTVEF